MKWKNYLTIAGISLLTSLLSIWGFSTWMQNRYAGVQQDGKIPANYAAFFDNEKSPGTTLDFTTASISATPAVVHIKTKTKAKKVTNNIPKKNNSFGDMFGDEFFNDFFGGPRVQYTPEQRASGSGVIISEDGYIVTNNHVIEGADEINITLTNKKSYKATLIGSDPNSDLAVLKIDGSKFPYILYGNSDEVKLGQWVLAIGYPLSLDVTVTAGIISAKARSLQINQRNKNATSAIESFLQTDAAVNLGNSGGALINTDGQLVGINAAIASPTGSYAGYSYAIPVNITKKIVNDIIKYGAVQRAYLGINYPREDISDEQKAQEGIKDGEGVYVMDIIDAGAAKEAGIKKGDFITKINNVPVLSGPEMVEQIASYKPGDKITIAYLRGGKTYNTTVTLKNKAGNYSLVKVEESNVLDKLGGDFETFDKKKALANSISGGILVKKINDGLLKNTRMQEGFVITTVNGKSVNSIEELKEALKNESGSVRLEGIYPGYEGNYGYPLNLNDN